MIIRLPMILMTVHDPARPHAGFGAESDDPDRITVAPDPASGFKSALATPWPLDTIALTDTVPHVEPAANRSRPRPTAPQGDCRIALPRRLFLVHPQKH